jgi:hypothetical protein
MFVGMPIGYGRVKTLTDASVRNCRGDIAELKPTIMTGVPAVVRISRLLPEAASVTDSGLSTRPSVVGDDP